jgi:hypothetical protein
MGGVDGCKRGWVGEYVRSFAAKGGPVGGGAGPGPSGSSGRIPVGAGVWLKAIEGAVAREYDEVGPPPELELRLEA